MLCLHFMVFVVAIALPSNAVKVNLQGSLSLGRAVMDTISHYFNKDVVISRRAMSMQEEKDRITATIKSAAPCRGLDICQGELQKFINEYLITLAKAIEVILESILNPNGIGTNRRGAKLVIFEDQLKSTLRNVKKILKAGDVKLSEENEAFVWVDVMKRISAEFQQAALLFLNERLEGDPKAIKEIKKTLVQKLVLAVIIVESKYETKLCVDFKICEKEYEISQSLHDFLKQFKEIPEDKAREFMKYFYDALPEKMLFFLKENTATEFQIILSDMTLKQHVATKEILLSVNKIVEERLNLIKNKTNLPKAFDSQLIYIILSDLDHVYNDEHKVYPFDDFLQSFRDWVRSFGKFNTQLKRVLRDIRKKLSSQPEGIIAKLTNQVRVFLELTVDKE